MTDDYHSLRVQYDALWDEAEQLRNKLASARAHHEADNALYRGVIPKIQALIGTSQHSSGVCKGLQLACDIIKGETNGQ